MGQITATAILGRGGRLYRDFHTRLARKDEAYRAQCLAQARALRGPDDRPRPETDQPLPSGRQQQMVGGRRRGGEGVQ